MPQPASPTCERRDVAAESSEHRAAPGGRNTGFHDALGVLVRMLERGRLQRDEVEEVIVVNCRRQGRPVPGGSSMQRRVERLRATLEQGGLALETGPGTELARSPSGGGRVPVDRREPTWRS